MPKVAVDFSKVSSFEPIPSGIYEARITKIEEKATKDGSGSYLNIEFTIQDGEFENRKVWTKCSLTPGDNGLPKGMFIMRGICEAIGMDLDLAELDTDHWVGELIKIEVEKKYSDYFKADENIIKKFLK